MESFYFLIPIGLIFVAIALRFLFWAINSGQYDNLDTEAHRILFEEDKPDSSEAAEPAPTSGQSSASVASEDTPSESAARIAAAKTPSSRSPESSHD